MVRVRSGESGKAERSPGSEIVPGSIVRCGVPGSVLTASGNPDGVWRHQTPVNPRVTLGLTRLLYFHTKPQRTNILKFILY